MQTHSCNREAAQSAGVMCRGAHRPHCAVAPSSSSLDAPPWQQQASTRQIGHARARTAAGQAGRGAHALVEGPHTMHLVHEPQRAPVASRSWCTKAAAIMTGCNCMRDAALRQAAPPSPLLPAAG